MQETRHWDAGAKRTSALRSKEEAHDYRYFPEPDMVPFEFAEEYVECIAAKLPELPDAKKERFVAEYGLTRHRRRASLADDVRLAGFFDAAVEIAGRRARQADRRTGCSASWRPISMPRASDVAESRITPAMLAELVELIEDGTISSKQAKEVFAEMAETGDAPGAIVELKGMKQVTDTGELEAIVDKVLAENPDKVEAVPGRQDRA